LAFLLRHPQPAAEAYRLKLDYYSQFGGLDLLAAALIRRVRIEAQ
jgi:hypothetical protein